MVKAFFERLGPNWYWLVAVLFTFFVCGYAGVWVGGGAPKSGGSVTPNSSAPRIAKPEAASAPPVVVALPPSSRAEDDLRWPLWEFALQSGIPARSEALTPPPWRFIGAVMVEGSWRLIVLRQGAAEPEFYKKGDRLPGGYTIRDIGEEDVTLLAGRRATVFSYIGSP